MQIDDRMVLMPGNHMNHLNHGLNSTTTTTAATAAVAVGRVMETQQPLKCPRCDSSNTKFCYYNNYSLSQPRHFCKACKRYWTRGGTLRNVPVGGGCRKNKRVKKPSSSSTASTAAATTTAAMVSDPQSLPLHIPNFSLPTSSSLATIDPIFFGLNQNSTELNVPSFLKRLDQRSSGIGNYNLNPNFSNPFGLCFPTAGVNQDYNAGIPFQIPGMASTSLVHDFSLLGSSLSSSLIASTLRQPTLGLNSPGWTVGYDDIPATVGNSGGPGLFKGVKEEDGTINGENQDGRLQWQIPSEPNQLENTVDATNSLYWNITPAGIATGWAETTAGNNCGS